MSNCPRGLVFLFGLAIATAFGGDIAAAQNEEAIADFSGYWLRPEPGPRKIFYEPVNGPGPVNFHADAGEMRRGVPMLGDHTDPILLPTAAEAVKAQGDRLRRGEFVWPAWSLCWPPGVPLVLNLSEPVQMLQTEDQVTILYQRGRQVRRIDLNAQHPEASEPNWYGHSVGHYEGTDTLVVDTIAQDTRSVVDRFGTPKSPAIHVVERYTVSPDGQSMQVTFLVEDQNMFTTAWSSHVPYEKMPPWVADGPTEPAFAEIACAENNRDPGGGDFPSPFDNSPDF